MYHDYSLIDINYHKHERTFQLLEWNKNSWFKAKDYSYMFFLPL